MAFSTYAELQSELADLINRTDLNAKIPGFIQLNETTLNRILEVGEMELSTTLTTIADNPNVALPTGYAGLRRLRIEAQGGGYNDVQIFPLEPSLDSGLVSYRPIVASIVGSNINLRPTPNGAYTMPMDYWGKFTPLSDADPVNWLLTDNPDIYLYGSAIHASIYLGDDNRVATWKNAFTAIVDQINDADVDKRFRNMKLRADAALTYPRRFNVYSGWGG